MREIKFRAWIKNNEEMCEVIALQSKCLSVRCIDSSTIYMDSKQPMTQKIFSLDKVELMQYTGLKDNTEKDIYEGDIISFLYNDIQYTGKIEFEAGMFILCNEYLPNSYIPIFDVTNSYDSEFWVEGEIIGNIYE